MDEVRFDILLKAADELVKILFSILKTTQIKSRVLFL